MWRQIQELRRKRILESKLRVITSLRGLFVRLKIFTNGSVPRHYWDEITRLCGV